MDARVVQRLVGRVLRKWKLVAASGVSLLVALVLYRRKQQQLALRYFASPNQVVFVKPQPTPLKEIVYDYIVVGGGSAGCVVASRLSEDPNVTVLLLEAGGDDTENFEVSVPAAAVKIQRTDADWGYTCETEENTNNRVHYWPRGKIFGGCSSINWMLYVRGNKDDFDGWERMGCKGWSYKDVLPYFKKSEDRRVGASGNPLPKETEYHGVGGPLAVSDCRYKNPLTDLWIKAATEIGLENNPDYNGESQFGVGRAQTTIQDGVRHNTFAAFLRPLNRKNLTVIPRAYATRVLLHGNRATGVAFINGYGKFTPVTTKEVEVHARREVIVSGGTVNSAQLLLLSGIGPREQLQKFGIPVVQDLPVGLNMQDHIMVPVAMEIKEKWSLNEKTADTLWNLLQYMFFKKGVFSSQHLESMAFLKTRPELNYPDLQLHFSNGLLTEGVAQIFGIPMLKAAEWGVTILPTLLHPKSLGSVQLRSSNPLDAPIIKPNYLADPEDRRVLIEGVKIARKILNSEAFKSIQGPMINDDTIPYPLDSDEYVLEYIKRYVFTVFHPVGTCRMGPEGDPNSVCDPQLRVRGIQGLRVIDASIMPEVISGNTNAPAIMIGERGADLIKETWKNTPCARM